MSLFSVSFLIVWNQLKCSVCPEVFLPMLAYGFSGFKAASLQDRDYDAAPPSLSAHFCSASYFPFVPAVDENCTNVPFPKCDILVYDMTYVWHPYSPRTQQIFPLLLLHFWQKLTNNITALSTHLLCFSACSRDFYPFPFLLP